MSTLRPLLEGAGNPEDQFSLSETAQGMGTRVRVIDTKRIRGRASLTSAQGCSQRTSKAHSPRPFWSTLAPGVSLASLLSGSRQTPA